MIPDQVFFLMGGFIIGAIIGYLVSQMKMEEESK